MRLRSISTRPILSAAIPLRLFSRSGGGAIARDTLRTWSAADWGVMLPMLAEHGLGGYLYSILRGENGLEESLPGIRELRRQWQSQWINNVALLGELEELASEAGRAGIAPGSITVLKGAALLGDVYLDPGSRSMGDVDLLVGREAWSEVTTLLAEAGFEPVRSARWKANDFKLLLRKRLPSGLEVDFELHRRLFFGEPESGLEWRKVPHSGGRLTRLSPTDQLVHLAGHLVYQHTFLCANWLVDIDHHLARHGGEIDWGRVWSLCEALGQRRSLMAALRVASSHLGTLSPGFPSELLREPEWDRNWGALVDEAFLSSPQRHFVRYYLLKHLVKDTWREALGYDWHWLKGGAWR